MVMFLKGLLSHPNKVVKFEQVRDSARTSHYVSGTPNFCTDLITQESFIPDQISVISYVQEREDNFAPELDLIQKYKLAHPDTYTQIHLPRIVEDVANIAIVDRCRLFHYYDFDKVKSLDPSFVKWAAKIWIDEMGKRGEEVRTILDLDRREFMSTGNNEGIAEVDSILNVIETELDAAIAHSESATTYADLIKVWPSVLLPRPRGI